SGHTLESSDFIFNVPEYRESELSSFSNGQKFILTNQKNVPLGVNITFSNLTERFSVTNFSNVIHIADKTQHYILLHTGNWSPSIIKVDGIITTKALHMIPTNSSFGIFQTLQEIINVEIRVGVNPFDYGVVFINGIIAQYEISLSANYNQIVSVPLKLIGTGDVTISPESVNASILSVEYDSVYSNSPVNLTLNNNYKNIIITLLLNVENTLALLIYNISVNGTALREDIFTVINVGSEAITYEPHNSQFSIFILKSILILIPTFVAIITLFLLFNKEGIFKKRKKQ
ncbi:MAG: hypothetical protein V1934_07510, partial [Methanobacteriota archaeon]